MVRSSAWISSSASARRPRPGRRSPSPSCSAARGEAGPKSDVDLGILLEPYDPALRLEIEGQLGRAAGRPLDMVLLDEAPPLLRFEITRDGVLLFERRPHLWTDFKVKAMLDWWDWAPTARAIQRTMIERLREKVAHGAA